MNEPRFADTIARMLRTGLYEDNRFMTGMATVIDNPATKRIIVDADLWESLLNQDDAPARNKANRHPLAVRHVHLSGTHQAPHPSKNPGSPPNTDPGPSRRRRRLHPRTCLDARGTDITHRTG